MYDFKYGSYGYIAQKDLNRAYKSLDMNESSLSALCAQQAVEKILKHYIIVKGLDKSDKDLLKSHNVRRLATACKLDSLELLINCLGDFDSVYHNTCYPSKLYYEVSVTEAQYLITLVESVFKAVEKNLYGVSLESVRPIKEDIEEKFGSDSPLTQLFTVEDESTDK